MAQRYEFNPPPGWAKQPLGWQPPAGWRPDPAWGPGPEGWHFWLDANGLPPVDTPVAAGSAQASGVTSPMPAVIPPAAVQAGATTGASEQVGAIFRQQDRRARTKKFVALGAVAVTAVTVFAIAVGAAVGGAADSNGSPKTNAAAVYASVPNVVGMHGSAARESLQAANVAYTVTGVSGSDTKDSDWVVATESPGVGSKVRSGDKVVLVMQHVSPKSTTSTAAAKAAAAKKAAEAKQAAAKKEAAQKAAVKKAADERAQKIAAAKKAAQQKAAKAAEAKREAAEKAAAAKKAAEQQQNQVPEGATGKCNDGTYSFAAHHQGMCSWHGGVAVFYD